MSCWCTATAQTPAGGSLDPSFKANLQAFGQVYALARQTNGSLIVGGWFQEVNGEPRANLARIDAVGKLEATFNPAVNNTVLSVALQPDGKIVIGGSFTAIAGASVGYLARLTAAGQADPNFQFGVGANGPVNTVIVQPDSKILVAGQFSQIQGKTRNGLARLLANGSLDTTFKPLLDTGSQVYALALQSDGRLVIGGWFSSINGVSCRNLARLNVDGSLNASFSAKTGRDDWVNALRLQPDGRIIVGGSIREINLASRNQMARLNADGSLDASFAPGARLNGEVNSLNLDEQGRILVAGRFDDANGKPSRGIARFQPDGKLDGAFVKQSGVNGVIAILIPGDSGSWLAGGAFDSVNGVPCDSLVRFGPDGVPDPSLSVSTSSAPEVWCLAVEPDGRLLIGGRFNRVGRVTRNGIARLGLNGELDPTFDPGSGINGTVYCLTRDAAGSVWAGGRFNLADGRQQHSVARLSADGAVAADYKPFDWLDHVYAVLPLADDSLLTGGYYWAVGGVYNCLSRLKPGGTLDFDLPIGWGANNEVRALLPLPDGRVLMGGFFTGVAGAWHKGIARLNPDGSVDRAFKLDLGNGAAVLSLLACPDSKILVGGSFSAYNRTALLRLTSDGSVDTTLNAGSGPNGWIHSLKRQTDSKIVAAGNFTQFNDVPAQMIVRLNPNGSVDTSFSAPTDIDALVRAVAIQPGGGIVVGGGFSQAGGQDCAGLVRLLPGN